MIHSYEIKWSEKSIIHFIKYIWMKILSPTNFNNMGNQGWLLMLLPLAPLFLKVHNTYVHMLTYALLYWFEYFLKSRLSRKKCINQLTISISIKSSQFHENPFKKIEENDITLPIPMFHFQTYLPTINVLKEMSTNIGICKWINTNSSLSRYPMQATYEN